MVIKTKKMTKPNDKHPANKIIQLLSAIIKASGKTDIDSQIEFIEILNTNMMQTPTFLAIIQSLKELRTINGLRTTNASMLSKIAIENMPKDAANKIKDREGYVEVMGFGKIHIDNWPTQEDIDKRRGIIVNPHYCRKPYVCSDQSKCNDRGGVKCKCNSNTL